MSVPDKHATRALTRACDETLSMDDRVTSLVRLRGVAPWPEAVAALAPLTSGASQILQGLAMELLLGPWVQDAFVDRALAILDVGNREEDADFAKVRAADALQSWLMRNPAAPRRVEVLRVLAKTALEENDEGLIHAAYAAFINTLDGPFTVSAVRSDPNTDLDRERLERFLNGF